MTKSINSDAKKRGPRFTHSDIPPPVVEEKAQAKKVRKASRRLG